MMRRRKLLTCGVITFVALLLMILLFVWLLQFRPAPLSLARTLGFCPVDVVHTSPSGSNTLRVFITDGGATGYGGIFVYQKTFLGYDLLWADNPAVASLDEYSISWVSESEFDVRYTKPGKGGLVKRIKID